MTSLQLLLLNLLYDILCLVLPWDHVDEEICARPLEWSGRTLGRFMRFFGPISSFFDILTFSYLFFVLCPSVCGGSFASLAGSGEALRFIALFQTGWFLESMWTQVLILHLLRTPRIPLLQSRPSRPVMLVTLLGTLFFTVLTFTPAGSPLGLTPCRPSISAFWPLLSRCICSWSPWPKAGTSAAGVNCCKRGGICDEKTHRICHAGFLPCRLAFQRAPHRSPSPAAQELLEGLGDLMNGSAESLMLELGEGTHETTAEDTIRCGSLSIDFRLRRVSRDGAEISLTPKEFDILYFLARNRGEVFTKEQIYQAVWESDYLLDDSNIMAFIRKLRKKIEPNPDTPQYILTIWGIGYKFSDKL